MLGLLREACQSTIVRLPIWSRGAGSVLVAGVQSRRQIWKAPRRFHKDMTAPSREATFVVDIYSRRLDNVRRYLSHRRGSLAATP